MPLERALAVDRCLGNGAGAPDGSSVRSKGSKPTICVWYSYQCYILWYDMRFFELDA